MVQLNISTIALLASPRCFASALKVSGQCWPFNLSPTLICQTFFFQPDTAPIQRTRAYSGDECESIEKMQKRSISSYFNQAENESQEKHRCLEIFLFQIVVVFVQIQLYGVFRDCPSIVSLPTPVCFFSLLSNVFWYCCSSLWITRPVSRWRWYKVII